LEGVTVERVGEGIKLTIAIGVPFEQGSVQLAPETMDYLSRLAVRLAEFPDCDLLVVGHSDRTGTPDDNLRLSEMRALAALDYLATEGIARTRMTHLGRGEAEPVVFDDRDEAASRANRRMEIAIFANHAMKSAAMGGGAQP
jgi:outer membrane protein OmpA-like peptidoglycan-associated protein